MNAEITPPIFLFPGDQMIVTDRLTLPRADAAFLRSLEAFDSVGLRLTPVPPTGAGSASSGAALQAGPPDPARLKEKILAFWQASGNPLPGLENLDPAQTVEATLRWLKEREWKTYRRGTRLFWTMMLPCGLIPFAIGFFKMPRSAVPLAIYAGCFAGAMLTIALLHRLLYPKPRFPEPAGAARQPVTERSLP